VLLDRKVEGVVLWRDEIMIKRGGVCVGAGELSSVLLSTVASVKVRTAPQK
jgi:hypothetical protein